MKQLKVCVVGSGGREHALQLVLARHVEVVVTPGNPGIPGSVVTKPEEIEADLFVIGPEAPLVDGLADRLRTQGKLVFGPGVDGAELEGSKAWMKDLLRDAKVPTADYRIVTSEAGAGEAFKQLLEAGYDGWAIKTDGLAAGKGVTVTKDLTAAMQDVRDKFGGKFGQAGTKLVIEGLLAGKSKTPAHEVSIFAICNGTEDYVLLEGAQDYKLLKSDSDLMTGGVGAYSPTRDQAKLAGWAETTIRPVLRELRQRGIDYRGVLYAGLMIVDDEPYVLEFNIRFGDPETEVVLPRITSNLVEVLMQAAAGKAMDRVEFSNDIMIARVLCSEGYPTKPRTGDVIVGLEAAQKAPNTLVFCASVSTNTDGQLVTAGGRVLVVVSSDPAPKEAIRRVNASSALITWPGVYSRDDIGQELLADR